MSGGAVMAKDGLVADVRPADDATSVYPTPMESMERPGKVAVPVALVRAVSEPASVPEVGLVPIAMWTGMPLVATGFPSADWTVTAIPRENAAFATELDGGTE